MKKTILLTTIFLISFFFCNCSTVFSILYGSTKCYEYNFINYKNKNTKAIKNEYGDYYTEVIIDDFKFYFYLSTNGQYYDYDNDIIGGSYKQKIYIRAPKGKYIDNILINKVVICAGETEYNMLEIMDSVLINTADDGFFLEEEEIADIRRTGLIEHTVYINEKDNMRAVSAHFISIPIDFKKHKKIKIIFDIFIKYTTEETININQELVGLLKMKHIPRFDYFYIPYLMD
jgi:hypothetical protein